MLYKYTIQKFGVLVCLLGILLSACGNKTKKAETATAPEAADNKLPVDMVIAQEQNLSQEETVVGTMLPFQEVAIVGELAQKVTKVAFADGSDVSKGAPLYILNDATIRAKLKQIDAELELARLNKDRMANLLATETAKQQEYDEAAMRLHALEAQQDLLRAELEKTVIRAPFSGRIGISTVHQGAYVVPGTPLVSLQDQHNLKISFSVAEKYLHLVAKGTKIKFTTELSEQPYTATVMATEAGLDEQGRSLKVQALVSNNHNQFRSGLSAKVYFSTDKKDARHIMVPNEALMPGEKGYNAFIIKNGKAKSVPVAIGSRTEASAIISSGLAGGDSIIISNMLRIAEGTPVKVVASH